MAIYGCSAESLVYIYLVTEMQALNSLKQPHLSIITMTTSSENTNKNTIFVITIRKLYSRSCFEEINQMNSKPNQETNTQYKNKIIIIKLIEVYYKLCIHVQIFSDCPLGMRLWCLCCEISLILIFGKRPNVDCGYSRSSGVIWGV